MTETTAAPVIYLDLELLDEIADGMDLRVPNAEAVAAIAGRLAAHQAAGTDEPFEAVVDVATGVGKTYVMAAAIEYLAALGVRTFVTVCHRKAILDKTVANFTPGHPKSVVDHMTVRPVVVTIDDLDAAATHTVGGDPDQVTLYLLSVQSLQRPTTKVGRRTHDFREALGDGLYAHLADAPDLVVFADEHHVYFGPSFSAAIRDLTPLALVGLTGTPHRRTPEDSIVYRYPLAEAIADELVKTPVIVGRSDDLADDTTKLRDGLTLLRAKQRAADAFVEQHGLPARNLLMLVVAQSIEDAEAVEAALTSDAMFEGAYADAVLRIDSSQPEEALVALEQVEDPESRVRVIVSVQMLQEGWDVATVAVIVSLRASVSDILTEQTLGRGLRLPWGSYVEAPLLNQLDVLAHERYEQVLERAGVALREQRVDWETWQRQQLAVAEELAARSASAEAAEAVREELAAITRYHDRAGAGSLAAGGGSASAGALPDGRGEGRGSGGAGTPGAGPPSGPGHGASAEAPGGGASPLRLTVERLEDRQRDVDEDADAVAATMRPRPDLPRLRLPIVATQQVRSSYQLVDLAPGLRPRFVELGRRYAADPEEALRRTAVDARVEVGPDGVPRTVVTTRAAEDRILASTEEVSVDEVRYRIERAILHSNVATGRPTDRHPAALLAEAVLDGAGDDAPVLGRYLDQVTGAVVTELGRAVADSGSHLATDVTVEVREVGGPRPRFEVVLDRSHGDFQRRAGYRGWNRSVYEENGFDSSTERDAALLFDDAPEVEVWLRLRTGDLSVDWTGEGRERTYHPDFLVAEQIGERHGRVVRRCFVVEVKADRDLDDPEVLAKHEAAVRWAARVNADGAGEPDEWHVLLVGETALREARGSWPQLLRRARTDLG